MKWSRLLGAVCASIFSIISISPHATLVDAGGGLIYDTVLDITWAQPDGIRNWDNANTWAAGLTLGGVSGWRLPYISLAEGTGPFTGSPVDCNTASELDCRDNELGYMFYNNLGGTFGQSILISGDPDLALFPTLKSFSYWSGTAVDSSDALGFFFNFGNPDLDHKDADNYTWAVHVGNIGDVVVVPIPASLWLFGTGLLGIIGVARRKRIRSYVR